MEAGTTTRNVKWEMPDKRTVDLSITRMTDVYKRQVLKYRYYFEQYSVLYVEDVEKLTVEEQINFQEYIENACAGIREMCIRDRWVGKRKEIIPRRSEARFPGIRNITG